MKFLKTHFDYKLLIIIVSFLIGSIGVSVTFTRSYFLFLTPLFLFLLNLFVLIRSFEFKKDFKLILLFIIITIVIEIIGVKTGSIFGNYSYGETLGVKIFGVPIVIGLNWLLLITSSSVLVSLINYKNIFLNAFLTALVVTFLDFLIEPVAIKLDFWLWLEGLVPVRNYLSWFIISFLISLFSPYFLSKKREKRKLLLIYLLGQFLFFCLCNILL